ncbi:unnamed protein product [Acanthoscelides obtectus]|uniref:GDP-fucose protein O-fucosyltransferase 2 n=1 Tax=Acanthoscelides obtectus TaxID=200917 RepID=A0A9P0L5M3_ACAOB|nr:unnamed protein product [Acanthoscelides obtectus]CAK1637981.1 GDP-fucose protein O-fucosyltransferase 2 [Acanthoscelides obtectus]
MHVLLEFYISRYLLYDVNPPEGFNLRLDVYMRLSILAHKMWRSSNPALNRFKLVLPPWSQLVHWEYTETPEYIPWGYYFDLESLKRFAPVIEMYEFFNEYPNKYSRVTIDEVYTLQHFEDMFETGNFEDRMELKNKCKEDLSFFLYSNITANKYYCLSYHGPATKLSQLFLNTTASSILINHAEVSLHEHFGGKVYWQARRSLRYSKELVDVAAKFRKEHLDSDDENDKTVLPGNWEDEKPGRRAVGGPYLAIHLRRRDFLRFRVKESPSLKSVAEQVSTVLIRLNFDTVYVATDASVKEFENLSSLLKKYKVKTFTPSEAFLSKYKDGGAAIVDQIICSHARYFIGTHQSTFTYRIEERREILGFDERSTFNSFCSNGGQCPETSVWKIVY